MGTNKKNQNIWSKSFSWWNVFGHEGLQNIFIYQGTFDTLELKEEKSAKYVISWKSKRRHNFKLTLLCTAFLYNVKLSVFKIGTQFNKSVLVIEKSYYTTKFVNVYVAFDLQTVSRKFRPEILNLKKFLVWCHQYGKNSNKSKLCIVAME